MTEQPQSNQVALRIRLDSLSPDNVQILKYLEMARVNYSVTPYIREYAVSLLQGIDNNDRIAQVNALTEFVRSNLTYVSDPAGEEYICSPVYLLQRLQSEGMMHGDCEDHVLLLNSLLGSIGIATKFVGVKYKSSSFNHVITGVQIGGQFFKIDPCVKGTDQPDYEETLMV